MPLNSTTCCTAQFTDGDSHGRTSKLQRRIPEQKEMTDFTVNRKDRFCHGKDKAFNYEFETSEQKIGRENREDWKGRRR